jgi:predicted nucleotidyltransferase
VTPLAEGATTFERSHILRVLDGSRAYGTNLDSSDRDEVVVYIEGPDEVLQSSKAEFKPCISPTDPGVDLKCWSLRQFGEMARGGHLNALCLLFSPERNILHSTLEGRILLGERDLFLSKACYPKIAGFMKGHLEAAKTKCPPGRSQLVEKFGFDTKAAMHAIRAGFMGVQLLSEGRLSIPMEEPSRQFCAGVRNGIYGLDYLTLFASQLGDKLIEAYEGSSLPDEPSLDAIDLIASLHIGSWTRSRS